MSDGKKKFHVTKRNAKQTWIPDSDQRFAAIDVGSNGVRLLLSRVMTSGGYSVFAKESLVRMPIRLGADVFAQGSISKEKEEQLVSTMIAFFYLLQAYIPQDYRACATSAMREAQNGPRIAERIRVESGLDLEIIDGGLEAEMIFATHVAETLEPNQAYLYIDVGGGSTELSYFAKKQRLASKSFPIGTVRFLNDQVTHADWMEMQGWVLEHKPENLKLCAIGSGGNMNKMFRLAGKANDEPVDLATMQSIDEMLQKYNMEERIRVLHLRPDRADVIIPASKIFRSIMEWGQIDKIYVPQFGLVDGLVHDMYDKYNGSR